MRQVVEQIRGSAKRPYTHRGKVIQDRNTKPVWLRKPFNDRISYGINDEHPLVENLRADLDEDTRRRFDAILRMIGSTFPTPLIFTDMANHPRKVEQAIPDIDLLANLTRMMAAANPAADKAELKSLLIGIEPFASWPHVLDSIINEALKEK
jgi:hypothetical protein